jgi:hypothetical protein
VTLSQVRQYVESELSSLPCETNPLRYLNVIRNTLALFALTAAMLVSAQELPGASITFDLGAYKTVSVDEMIQRLSKPGDKQRYFIAPVPVKFSATLMQMPKPGTFQLVYDSLNAWGLTPSQRLATAVI